jgi:hypothetical protein
VANKGIRVRGLYGGARLERMQVELSRKHLKQFGECFVKLVAKEAKDDFAKRGWVGKAYDGTPPIWESFSYRISGDRTIEILSTFPGLATLTGDGVPEHAMEWLTQEAKDKHPTNYKLTETERKRGMKQSGHVSQGERLPLIVPVEKNGTVIFRAAPLKLEDAWVHPGIARFTFMQRAARKASQVCAHIFGQAAVEYLAKLSNRR